MERPKKVEQKTKSNKKSKENWRITNNLQKPSKKKTNKQTDTRTKKKKHTPKQNKAKYQIKKSTPTKNEKRSRPRQRKRCQTGSPTTRLSPEKKKQLG